MQAFHPSKTFSALAFVILSFAVLLMGFLAQNTQTSPSPSPLPSPSPPPKPSGTPTPLPGAQNFHQWGSITVFNGLPSDSVRAIAQTNDGVMWFGTDNGLARFDGRRIQKIGLGNDDADRILSLETSPTGELWIGTSNGAFVSVNDRVQPVDNTHDTAISAIDVGTSTFLGTDNGLLLRVTGDTGQSVAELVNAEPIKAADGGVLSITSVRETNGKVLVGTTGRGVLVLKGRELQQLGNTPGPGGVNSLTISDTGQLWVGTDATKGVSGIYSADPNGRGIKRIAAPTARVLAFDANETGLWVGTERYGLFQIIDGKLKKSYTFANTSGGLRSDTVNTLFTDREGVLWIGTNRGVSRFDRLGAEQQTVSDIPNSNFVRSLFRAASGDILAGTNRGLFEKSFKDWHSNPRFEGKVIYTIAEHCSTAIMIGTSSGLFDDAGKLLVAGDVRSFAKLGCWTYAAVYGKGVYQIPSGPRGFGLFDPDNGSAPLLYSNPGVTAIFGDKERLWIGTNGQGLFSSDGKNVKLEIAPEVLKSGTIWKIAKGADGSLWIAGQHGVFRIVDGQVTQIDKTEDSRDVIVIGDTAWAATTTRGLLHIKQDPRFNWLVSAFGFEQGLPSEKAFSIMPVDDELFIATNRGVVTYKPRDISPKIIATRVLSQRVHGLAELNEKIDLEYPQNSLLIEVAGQSSRTFPEEFQYAFVLTNAKGDEVAHQISNEPQYAPSELKPGDYTIEAIAFNRDLLPSEPLFIRFSVAKAPFPWTATALGILLAIAIVGLVWAVVEHRRIRHRNRELAAARFDLANEAERERRRIARDLHDQTLADLRNLMLLSDKISPDKPEFRAEIESVSSEIRRICEDLSPSVLENVGLVASLEFLLKRTIENSSFSAEENLEDRIRIPMNAQLQVYRIAQEVLTNIKKHSSANRVHMLVSVDQETKLRLMIKDNGERFDQNGKKSTGRGIANIRARASLIKAKADWSSELENENQFTLEVGV
jgi:signal transduction histidine kinase